MIFNSSLHAFEVIGSAIDTVEWMQHTEQRLPAKCWFNKLKLVCFSRLMNLLQRNRNSPGVSKKLTKINFCSSLVNVRAIHVIGNLCAWHDSCHLNDCVVKSVSTQRRDFNNGVKRFFLSLLARKLFYCTSISFNSRFARWKSNCSK